MQIDGKAPYDSQNVFARILRGEVPCNKVFENEWVMAFHDIAPKAPVHVLIIPRQAYVSFMDFHTKASPDEIVGVMRSVGEVARHMGLEKNGYRLITNAGPDSGQEVPHFHIHLLGGKPLPLFPV
ncbi:MAG: histidine triad nucleotide-binding protein [Acetobacter sp.]|nr:histidine triad nucleotide-binding protein [Acetobacter sp.]MBO6036072.1 histidine triad nucleotide-binding protein [Acetobacter sp.]MBO6043645.1 histidine triad nucleotide-binding protein [Acetobacter sp.]MBO6084862.1 histidine triad nucleotide-binding protein [Acetobacter sp.]MBO7350040.1 histidine triad nucleotide-binding protein [Acetobacter sp.]